MGAIGQGHPEGLHPQAHLEIFLLAMDHVGDALFHQAEVFLGVFLGQGQTGDEFAEARLFTAQTCRLRGSGSRTAFVDEPRGMEGHRHDKTVQKETRFVRGHDGQMVPFNAFSRVSWTLGSPRLERYDGSPSLDIQGAAAPGRSTGEAMTVIDEETSTIWASTKLGKVYDGLFRSLNQMSRGEDPSEPGGDWQAELVRLKLFVRRGNVCTVWQRRIHFL